jgi:Na+-driven multidrug efflux pump
MSKYITFNTALGCTVNIGLNIILIPRLGVKGAAISTVTAQGAAVFVSLLVFSKTRHLALFMLRSFNIIRILKSLQSKYL